MDTHDVGKDDVAGDDAVTQVFHNPLLLKTIFKKSKVPELKSLKEVNNFCRSIANPFLVQKSMIVFDAPKNIEDFFRVFGEDHHLYSAFRFLRISREISQVQNFFLRQGPYIREVEFENLDFVDPLLAIDLSTIIVGTPLTLDFQSNLLTKLKITGQTKIFFRWNLFRNLHRLTGLTLQNCMVQLDDNIYIYKCTTLKLLNVKFWKKGINIDNISVNDIVDIRCVRSQLKIINCTIALQLNGDKNIKMQKLAIGTPCTVTNWGLCNWSIKKLDLRTVKMMSNQMDITELKYYGNIIGDEVKMIIPTLKKLHYVGLSDVWLKKFFDHVECHALVDLALCVTNKVDISCFPNSIRSLSFVSPYFRSGLTNLKDLEKKVIPLVVFKQGRLGDLENVLSNCAVTQLIFSCKSWEQHTVEEGITRLKKICPSLSTCQFRIKDNSDQMFNHMDCSGRILYRDGMKYYDIDINDILGAGKNVSTINFIEECAYGKDKCLTLWT